VIRRDADGEYHVRTSHHSVGTGATWGTSWRLPCRLLFFIPVSGMAVGAAGRPVGKLIKTGVDIAFQDQVQDLVKPGTSALFLMLEKVIPHKAVEAMSKFGGTVLKTSLSKDAEQELQEAVARGTWDPAAGSRSRLGAWIVGSCGEPCPC
jgi:uncharacterized membrane protein